MARYLIIDTFNLFYRTKYVVGKAPDIDTKISLALHITFQMLKKAWREFNANHIVFALEGKSWRRDYYAIYKQNRRSARAQRTVAQIEEDDLFFEIFDDFCKFLKTRTNVTILQHRNLEADDLIAHWIKFHPEDEHVILSNDSDFIQLLNKNVKIFNGEKNVVITFDGVFDSTDPEKRMDFELKIDGKIKILTKQPKYVDPPSSDWLEWSMFQKCIRGDMGDHILTAYPKARTVKLRQAFEDRANKGYDWLQIMEHRWEDHKGTTRRTLDDFERNKKLIDLSLQPEEVIEKINYTIRRAVSSRLNTQVRLYLLNFCDRYGLEKIKQFATQFSPIFSTPYKGKVEPIDADTEKEKRWEIQDTVDANKELSIIAIKLKERKKYKETQNV